MNMPMKQGAFDLADAHLLKQARFHQTQKGSQVWAGIVTLLAHVVAGMLLIAGLARVEKPHALPVITVHVEQPKNKPDLLPDMPQPALAKPSLVTAPIPDFTVARPAPPIAAIQASAPVPTAPAAPSIAQGSPNAVPNWQGLLLARLEAAKHYPEEARMHRQQGITMLRFTMDRDGKVLSAKIEKSSGFDALDQEALALIQRAQPLPKPPPAVTGDTIELVVPIEFTLTRHR